MSTLITGGLLGSAMTFGLKPSRQELDVLDSIKLEEYIINNKVDSVIHAAAKVGGVKANADFVYDYFSDNLSMSMNVMNMCKKYRFKKAIFVLSTCIFPSAAPLPWHFSNSCLLTKTLPACGRDITTLNNVLSSNGCLSLFCRRTKLLLSN